MKQGTTIQARRDLSLQGGGHRKLKVRKGDLFIVTSPNQRNIDTVLIDRKKTAKLNLGRLLSIADITTFFDVLD